MQERRPAESTGEHQGAPRDPLAFDEARTPGVDKLRAMLATAPVTAAQAAAVIAEFMVEYDAIMRLLQHEQGNAFVTEVEKYIHELFPPTETDLLLKWEPTEEKGEEGEAAWLLRAAEVGWLHVRGETRHHLEAYVKEKKSVESTENIPSKDNDHGIEPKRTVGKGKDIQGVYDVPVKSAAILSPLVHMVRTHAERRLADHHTMPTAAFDLGTMLRLDHGFGGSQHTIGSAMDLGGMHFDTVDDVMYALELLPPGKVSMVFPDNREHLHLSVTGGEFELGMPFEGNFFPEHMNITHKRKEAIAGAAAGTTELHVKGLYFGSTRMNASTGTYDAAKGHWDWTKPKMLSDGAVAWKFLKSDKLKDKLEQMGLGD